MFERPVTFTHGDGSHSAGRIDCYLRGHFILEAKKLRTGSHTKGFDDSLLRARSQAEGYSRALPSTEGRPPFLLVVDVGTVIEVYSEFSRTGGTYTPFPDPRNHRIALADLEDPLVRDRLRHIWTDPDMLNPAIISARVTREVSTQLAALARSLELSGHLPEHVAAYLARCLFSMFAEDVGLLPAESFQRQLETHRLDPGTLQQMLAVLWSDMDRGGFSAPLAKSILKFNGKLFKGSTGQGYSLLLTTEQIDLLNTAAKADWRDVEPAIFGTLLERALDPAERHALGAHYTPRAYVERLVLPTVIEPLRAEWANAQAAALLLAHEASELEANPPALKTKKDFAAFDRHSANVRAKWRESRQQVRDFHHRLCTLRVLDPACGSANFLYVSLEHLKRLEGEVLNQLTALGDAQDSLDLGRETVNLQQLRGIELNDRAAALAELVLWIGYLQWQIRTFGNSSVAEPVVHDYNNIEHRDAVLDYARCDQVRDEHGVPVTRWDGVSMKNHPVTGQRVPNEAARTAQYTYSDASKAAWPAADFIVGNPPFIGNKRMRDVLGDGYVDALRSAWPEVPESADFVMYWWYKAAETVRHGHADRFGLITTNSLTMVFNRRVVEAQQQQTPPLSVVFAIPDHPWVDNADGAAVRIAMSVGAAGESDGKLMNSIDEIDGENGETTVRFSTTIGAIHPDLKVGANVAGCKKLRANSRLSSMGMMRAGAGFLVDSVDQAQALGMGRIAGLAERIRPYRNGKDLTDRPRGLYLVDMFGLTSAQVREQYPAVYQWLLERVKPERDMNRRPRLREQWWTFGEPRQGLRAALKGLDRYIATVETAKHRAFVFLDAEVLPDHKLVAIASNDALVLGVLSSSLHGLWALAAGGTLEDRPVYSKSRCFDPFPFPDSSTGLTEATAERIRSIAAQIDGHRKRQQDQHGDLTLTAMYNVMVKLRAASALTTKDRHVYETGLVGVLRDLHDELDAAVLLAYGWQDLNLPDDSPALLSRIAELNGKRAAEEANGTIRWLRAEFQNAANGAELELGQDDQDRSEESDHDAATVAESIPPLQRAWPVGLTEQIKAVAEEMIGAQKSLDVEALAARFKGRGRWRERLPALLDTLVALGRIRASEPGRWIDTSAIVK